MPEITSKLKSATHTTDISLSSIKITLELRALTAISLPPYKGSALRGGFGHAFRKVVCAVRKNDCTDCLLKHRCAYSYVFETPPPPDTTMLRKYPRAPHPFVIEPPDEDKGIYEPGETLTFSLVLIGRGREYLPYFVYAFEELGKMGIGKGKGRYVVEEIRDGNDVIYTAESKRLNSPNSPIALPLEIDDVHRLSLSFITPARIKFDEQITTDPEFHILIRNLLRRISSLSYFHEGIKMELDYQGIIDRSMAVKTTRKDITWNDWERYSSRQDARMNLGGFVGKLEFAGELGEFMPFLRLGELVHIGKATSFGLGKYKIETGG